MGVLQKKKWVGGITDYWQDGSVDKCKTLKDFVLRDDKPWQRGPFRSGGGMNDLGCDSDAYLIFPNTFKNSYNIVGLTDGGKFYMGTVITGAGGNSDIGSAAFANYPKVIHTPNHSLVFLVGRCPLKLYADESGDTILVEAGIIPGITVSPQPSNNDGTSYIYGAIWRHTYTTYDGTTYIVESPVRLYQDTDSADLTIGGRYNASSIIYNINLTKDSDKNYDLDNIECVIYRTTNGGIVLKELMSFPTNDHRYGAYINATDTGADTLDIANVSANDNGKYFKVDSPIYFNTAGVMPTPLTVMTQYWVHGVTENGNNSLITVSATKGGSKINLTVGHTGYVSCVIGIIDTTTDANLTGAELYTTGGVLDFDYMTETAHACYTTNGILWWVPYDANLKSRRIQQVNQNSNDSSPAGNYVDLPVGIEALYSVDKYPIPILENGDVYRIDGYMDNTGSGTISKTRIYQGLKIEEGHTRNNGVTANNILFVASDDNIYAITPFKVMTIADHIPEWVKRNRYVTGNRQAVYIAKLNLLAWPIKHTAGGTGADGFLLLDLNYPLSKESTFYTWDLRNRGVEITSCCYQERFGRFHMGSSGGRLYRIYFNDDEGSYDDCMTDESLDTHYEVPVVPEYESCSFSMDKCLTKKQFKKLKIKTQNTSGLAVDMYSANDAETTYTQMKSVPVGQMPTSKSMYKAARYPRGNRYGYDTRVKITKGYTTLYKSDDYATCTISSTTATLDSGNWPSDLGGYYLYLEGDSTPYLIYSATGNSVELSSAPGNQSNVAWIIKGYPKSAEMNIEAYQIEFEELGEEVATYEVGDEQSNS